MEASQASAKAGLAKARHAMEYAQIRIAFVRQALEGACLAEWGGSAVDGLDAVLAEAEDRLLDAVRETDGEAFPALPD